jgi:hypothetical protein
MAKLDSTSRSHRWLAALAKPPVNAFTGNRGVTRDTHPKFVGVGYDGVHVVTRVPSADPAKSSMIVSARHAGNSADAVREEVLAVSFGLDPPRGADMASGSFREAFSWATAC